MSTPMHFRKRQLLEYQIETNSTQLGVLQQQTHIPESTNYNNIYEPEITFEYPMSPASIGSERLTPTENDENVPPNSLDPNAYSTEQMQSLAKNTLALLEMETLAQKSNKDTQSLTQIAESLTALESFAKKSTETENGKPTSLLHIAFNLKQTIEEYIKQEITNSSASNSPLSTLILAKLNQLGVNALSKSKEYLESSEEAKEMPEDLSMKSIKQEITQPVDDDVDYEESNLVIDESYVDESDDAPSRQKSKHNLHQLANRISGIFTFINRTQSRMEEFMRQGINVVSHTGSRKAKKKSAHLKKSKKPTNPLKPSNQTTIPQDLQTQKGPTNIPERKTWTNSGVEENVKCKSNFPIPSPFDKTRVIIGANGTTISTAEWAQIDWDQTAPAVTRKILMMVFDREYLATHSLTGRPSPAFLELNYPEKKPLNPYIVKDIVDLVTSRTMATPKEVRMAITTKCADESKMRRGREARQVKQNENLRMKPY